MLAGLTGKHIATAGRLGSGPALGPQCDSAFHAKASFNSKTKLLP
jgi:hypothetical protein